MPIPEVHTGAPVLTTTSLGRSPEICASTSTSATGVVGLTPGATACESNKGVLGSQDQHPRAYQSGTSLTKDAETRSLLAMSGLNPMQYAGHSYRIGAATTAASVGLLPWLIKTLRRWSSDCYERYIRSPNSLLSEVSNKLVQDMFN